MFVVIMLVECKLVFFSVKVLLIVVWIFLNEILFWYFLVLRGIWFNLFVFWFVFFGLCFMLKWKFVNFDIYCNFVVLSFVVFIRYCNGLLLLLIVKFGV